MSEYVVKSKIFMENSSPYNRNLLAKVSKIVFFV